MRINASNFCCMYCHRLRVSSPPPSLVYFRRVSRRNSLRIVLLDNLRRYRRSGPRLSQADSRHFTQWRDLQLNRREFRPSPLRRSRLFSLLESRVVALRISRFHFQRCSQVVNQPGNPFCRRVRSLLRIPVCTQAPSLVFSL